MKGPRRIMTGATGNDLLYIVEADGKELFLL